MCFVKSLKAYPARNHRQTVVSRARLSTRGKENETEKPRDSWLRAPLSPLVFFIPPSEACGLASERKKETARWNEPGEASRRYKKRVNLIRRHRELTGEFPEIR